MARGRKGGHAKPGPRKRPKQTKVIDGYIYVFDRQYTTRKGAERRAGTGRRIEKHPNLNIWYTWTPTGRRKK